jgi:hypothetical protein
LCLDLGCTNPVIYTPGTIVFNDQIPRSPHSWVILKAIDFLRSNGFDTEGNLAQKHLLPMMEGVTFNDVWGDADLAGGSVLDYYCPDRPDQDYGYGTPIHHLPIGVYKNSSEAFAANAFYGYGNAAEEAQFRFDYAERIYAGNWGGDPRDKMAGWVIDDIGLNLKLIGQEDPMNGRWASGTNDINNAVSPDGTHSHFGTDHTPEQALQDLFLNHTLTQVVNPNETEDELRNIHVPTDEVFMHAPEWLDDTYNHADDVEAYNGFGGSNYAWYAAWTLDSGGGHCLGGSDCAAPMVCRFPVGSKAHAFFQLGWAIHLLEDNTTPVHTDDSSLDAFEMHNDVETLADYAVQSASVNAGNVRDLLPAATVSDFVQIYDWPPTPGDSSCPAKAPVNPSVYFRANWWASDLPRTTGEGVAHAYVRNVAELSHQYMDYIKCINTEDDHNWSSMGFFTTAGLDNAIKTTAGLIRQYIEDVDKTPPTITIAQPIATNYLHTGTISLVWSVSDDESGVVTNSITATLGGSSTLNGVGLSNGMVISLLTNLTAGSHTFTVTALDNAHNLGSNSVTFAIVVTAASIIDDEKYFYSIGAITQDEGTSLLRKLQAGAAYRQAGDCKDANEVYQSFISELSAQNGKKVTPQAAAIMVADAQYLIAHCP